jgi:hypothetical protein
MKKFKSLVVYLALISSLTASAKTTSPHKATNATRNAESLDSKYSDRTHGDKPIYRGTHNDPDLLDKIGARWSRGVARTSVTPPA